jgi:hypothetical protein
LLKTTARKIVPGGEKTETRPKLFIGDVDEVVPEILLLFLLNT